MTRWHTDELKDSEIVVALRRDVPVELIWDQVTSELGAFFTTDTTGLSTVLDASTAAQATRTAAGEIMTTSVAIPISTVTVQETSFRTTYVTVPLTTRRPTTNALSSTTRTTTSIEATSASGSFSQSSEPSDFTNPISLPPFATSVQSSTTVAGAPSAETQDSTSAPLATTDQTVNDGSRKQAIIGGLSGSIAALILIGLIACLCWRRRKPRFDDDDEASMNEKGLRPILARKWSSLKSRAPPPRPPPPAASRVSTPDPEPDGQILRVSLENWPRPYAHEQGLRESMGPTTLRVMNPDLSRPTTPVRPSTETAGSFLKRQRHALAAALYGGRPGSSRGGSPQRGLHPPMPGSNVDPALSTEFLAPKAGAPSIRSVASTGTSGTVPVMIQRPPEDPFLTPPDESEERKDFATITRPAAVQQRPGIAPLQGAAAGGMMVRTLSHLNPFRTRSNASVSANASVCASSRSPSRDRQSVSTFSSAGDPFMLDRRSLRSGVGRPVAAVRGGEVERGQGGDVMMYEGT